MLIASLALAAAQPAVEPAPEQSADNEITVVANRLRAWRGTWRVNKGAVSCKTKRSTGDKAIDAIACDAMVACIGPLAPRFAAIEASKPGKAEMEQQLGSLLETEKVGDCLSARHKAGVAALVAARKGKPA